ncbi:hypothetical protein CK203_013534 [Vitis vinifera]|uniref:Reverse transcriptase zinc-binding domain-containing protein n=1 Tax=Vitis vinifera TaxID=29760 RepID=A0A438J935_VITVI|nr:hypothetical protein CK203_013534 [Vitis vinifera]
MPKRTKCKHFPVKIIWNPWVPSKVRFFAWEACWGKVLTLDQLQRRGWSLVNRRALCKEESETIDLFLLHCVKARVLWQLMFSLFRIQWIISGSVQDTLLGWLSFPVGRRCRKARRATPLCIFWTIWKERNQRVFEDAEMSDQSLKSSFLCKIALWIWVYLHGNGLSLVDCVNWSGPS